MKPAFRFESEPGFPSHGVRAGHLFSSAKPQRASTHQQQLSQFYTPTATASFMAGLFPTVTGSCRLLDAGAGLGALSQAFLNLCFSNKSNIRSVELEAFELDHGVHPGLHRLLAGYATRHPLSFEITGGDFINRAVDRILTGQCNFTHSILNPPYQKLGAQSPTRLRLRQVGIETSSNMYSAFVALSLLLMEQGGHVVAIIPRSFCNGPYFRSFRHFVLERAAIRHLHVFESRDRVFKDDGVLQETIVVMLERGGRQGNVTVTISNDDGFADLRTYEHPFERIVCPGDFERFVRIPTSPEPGTVEQSPDLPCTLQDLNIQVSTGPILDYRLREHLCDMPEPGTVPLVYPSHCRHSNVEWPRSDTKRPNAIRRNTTTEKFLYPTGWYCVVHRISSREEKSRICASVVDPASFNDADMLGFENHLNVLHIGRRGMPEGLARGLVKFLNSVAADHQIRQFSGLTQVNATDLRQMRFPRREAFN